jgi:acetyl-CoA/propionyl-CoA carboxylase biotin carboxyl carrier protein
VCRDVDVEMNGRRTAVSVWVPETAVVASGAAGGPAAARPRRSASAGDGRGAGAGTVVIPMQGTVVKVFVGVGDEVEAGQAICVLDARKMENNINGDKAGTVSEFKVDSVDSVGTGDIVAVID